MNDAIVHFFVCGVQKAGTTALDRYLRAHPAIEMAHNKEVHFFDDESQSWDTPDYTRLHSSFADSSEQRVRGEATPIYTYWPQSLERLRTYNPSAKLIMILRNPVLRAFSHWRMEMSRGLEELSFSEAIRPAGRARYRSALAGVHRVFSYVERGFYAPQVERLLMLFPREQVLFLRTDALWSQPEATLRAIYSFLELPPIQPAVLPYTVSVRSDGTIPLARDDAEHLRTLYADDIRETQRATLLDLSDWLQPVSTACEPMRP
jgi:hypothetical protein